MKRKLVILVLATLLLSMVGVTMAKPIEQTTVLWGMTADGEILGGGFGIVTFNTQSGEWSLTTIGRTLDTDTYYYFGITTSKPVKGVDPAPGHTFIVLLKDTDGPDYSGTVSDPLLSIINENIANGGVFLLEANSC